jgi:ribosomal protein L11 methyltransferase
VFSVLFQIDEEDQDLLAFEMWERGVVGVIQKYESLEAFFDDDALARAALATFPQYAPELRQHADVDWVAQTEASFPALEIGARFFVVPPWNTDPTPAGRMRLQINPGLACGTGWHPCTRMCLDALERHVRPGDRVLDIGVGSGILSVAAQMLGASFVSACDIDPEAVWVARDRVGTAALFIGSAHAVRPRTFDLAVANISAEAAVELYPELSRTARRVILSGFEQAPALAGEPLERLQEDGWWCVVYAGESEIK